MRHRIPLSLSSLLALLTLSLGVLDAQTRVTPPENDYSVADDVKLGREAAEQARKELPIMRDEQVVSYIQDLGRRLVNAIPPELRHEQFRYTFETVNVREINAFALPGGPMFVNRGMIEAANTEGEVAGVMAHEISHVALRHGTAQASKANDPLYQVGSIAGAIAGAILGGTRGRVLNDVTQFGLGVSFLRYGRDYERQADLEGAQIMARAGYDPRDMANMFKTIERQGGSGGPEWLSSHPNPGNRYEAITKEAESLNVENPIRDSRAFDRVKAYLKTLPRAPTTAEASRNDSNSGSGSGSGSDDGRTADIRPSGRVEAPSNRYVEYRGSDIFRISVPSNWRERSSDGSVTFAPEGASGRYNGQNIFTHGIELGVSRTDQRNLQNATEALIAALRQSNPRLARASGFQQGVLNGRRAIRTRLENVSDATGGREVIQLTTALTADGDLFYALGVAPRNDFTRYEPVFGRIVDSVRFTD